MVANTWTGKFARLERVAPARVEDMRRSRRIVSLEARLEKAMSKMKPRVLIVDDDPEFLEGMAALVACDECEVMTAGSGKAALALLARRPAAVVVSDYQMPGMDGIALLAEVTRRYPGTKRALVTGFGSTDVVSRAVNDGAVHKYFPKTADFGEIAKTIHALIFDARDRVD
jgi:DNA-binding NtrC family response regulator